jgi:hypothetical protein
MEHMKRSIAMLNVINSELPASDDGPVNASPTPPLGNSSPTHRIGLAPERLQRAKRSYATARIDLDLATQLVTTGIAPRAGDLVLARITKLGHHKRIENPDGRRAHLFPGDEVLLCYAARYASDQFEATIPDDLGACHMVAAGGIAAHCVNRHEQARAPTRIAPVGLVSDTWGRALNLGQFAHSGGTGTVRSPLTLGVLGTSMNSGKTTTAAAIARGLAARGHRVGAVKVTGTGAGCDRWVYQDAGAHRIMDFTDFGYASTYQVPLCETEEILRRGVNTLAQEGCDVVVVEVADGLFFPETARLVMSQTFRDRVDGVVLAASDSMSALAGRSWLSEMGMAPWAIAGCLTSSPLAIRELGDLAPEPIVPLQDMMNGCWIPEVLLNRLAAPA